MSMADADPARPLRIASVGGRELTLRILSALVLAPLALGVAYVGGWPFVVFWGVAATLVLWEWTSLVAGEDRRAVVMIGGASVVLAVALAGASGSALEGTHETRLLGAITVLAMGMLGVAALAPRDRRAWAASAIPYAGLLGVAPVVLRSDARLGFVAILFLFAVVWATDIVAYFVGRAMGGPKLSPRISPKKTWSGAVGGVAAAVAVAVVIARTAGLPDIIVVAALAAVLSICAQAGDLFESLLKRRFGAKDSGHLIPGHGGLMDRLDGFVAAAVVAAMVGFARGGLDAPARGLLVW
ncbi:MAG: phosphatidate cytidylyltransferase [Alphaproteobacteria bacterium]|nr:phosphatidate cytidylyltransferase [Alphaproteobacteria bacterium]